MPTTDWKTEIQKMDREWARNSVRQPSYEFSNGREFGQIQRPGQPYPWKGTAT